MKKVTKKKILMWLLSLWILPAMLALSVGAAEEEASGGIELPSGFSEAVEQLPEEVRDSLPDGLRDGDSSSVESALTEMTGTRYLLSVVSELLGISLGSAWKLLAGLFGLLVLCAFLREIGAALGTGTLSEVLRFCSLGCIFLTVAGTMMRHLSELELYFDRLLAMMGTMIPITGTVWAMGGNISTAGVGTATLYSFLAVCEALFSSSLFPIVGISTTLILCNLALPDLGTGQFLAAVRRVYTVGTGLLMTLLLASLAAQTTVGTAADSTGAKAAKFLSATVIPVVGGSVGDTLRSVASGVTYIKSVVGISGILFILLLLLPILIELLVTRFLFLLGSGAAELLGCEREGKLLTELGTVYGIMIAVVAMSAVMFILSFVIFLGTAVAIV